MPVKFSYIWIGSTEIPIFKWLSYPEPKEDIHVYTQFYNTQSDPNIFKSGKHIFYSGEFVMDEENANVVVRFMPSSKTVPRAIFNVRATSTSDSLCKFINQDRPNIKYIQLRLQELDNLEWKIKTFISKNMLSSEPKAIYDFLLNSSNITPYNDLITNWIRNKSNSSARQKKCLFMVTNPQNKLRRDIFFLLSRSINVDSAGKFCNNLSPDAIKPPRREDHDEYINYLKQYKFMITFENQSLPYYHTEKITNAFEAGVVPIYWGDPYITDVFDSRSFIHIKTYENPNQQWEAIKAAVQRVISALVNPKEYAEFFKYPPMKSEIQQSEDARVAQSIKLIAAELTSP